MTITYEFAGKYHDNLIGICKRIIMSQNTQNALCHKKVAIIDF